MKSRFLVLCACLYIINAGTGCKKSPETTPPPPVLSAKEQLLSSGTWTKVKDETYSTVVWDWFPGMYPWEKDDKYIFKPDKQYEVNTYELVDPSGSQTPHSRIPTGPRTWSLTNNESELSVTGNHPAVIETLSTTTLVLFYPKAVTGLDYDERVTYHR